MIKMDEYDEHLEYYNYTVCKVLDVLWEVYFGIDRLKFTPKSI